MRCTYLSIPQVARTHAVMLSRPFWMWGAEMGANEHGLAIGNEAVFTRLPCHKSNDCLTGMDLLRLALERATTARNAVQTITGLISTHGQGGNGGYARPMYYHNSFLLADPESVWLLETAGQHWAAREIDGVHAISNKLTIENRWDMASDHLVSFAVDKGWCRNETDFSFAGCYSDFLYTTLSASRYRQNRAMARLNADHGKLDVAGFMDILRDHGKTDRHTWHPAQDRLKSQICNHAGWGPVRISQTTGSMVSHLSPGAATHFVTGTAAPCTSIFKPIWVDTPAATDPIAPAATFDSDSLFWRHEILHRLTLGDYQHRLQIYGPEKDKLEAEFLEQALSLAAAGQAPRELMAGQAFERARAAENDWCAALAKIS